MNKLGYNILADGYSLQYAEDIKAAQAPYHLVMTVPQNGVDSSQDIATFDKWAELLAPAKIVRRTYSKLEGDWSLYRSAQEQVAIWKSQNRPQYIHEAPSNEPSLWRDPEINKRFVAKQVELMDRAADAGITVAAGVFSVGLPYEGYIENGIYDEFIRAVNRGNHFISSHLYGTGLLDLGEVIGYGAGVDPTLADIRDFKWPFGAEHKYWLLRRPDYFAHRAALIGEAIPPVLATEGIVDQIPDAIAALLSKVDRKYKMAKYNYDLRGILAWEEYYKAVWPELTLSQVAEKLARHALNNIFYPDFYKGVMLFAVNQLWDTPQGSNYGNAALTDFRKTYLPALAKEKPMFPDKNTPSLWESGTLTLTATKNIRSFPTNQAIGADIGDIDAGTYPLVKRSLETWKGGVYNWRAYQVAGMVDFYLADEVIAKWEVYVQPEPTPLHYLDIGRGTISGTTEDFKRLNAMLKFVSTEIEDLTNP